jgi:D-amino-acid dehydrogenase
MNWAGRGVVLEAAHSQRAKIEARLNRRFIGRSKLPNLFLNPGHGTLGWTHSCGSGKSIARIVSGLKPEVDFAFAGA